jgi:hypothetical protein
MAIVENDRPLHNPGVALASYFGRRLVASVVPDTSCPYFYYRATIGSYVPVVRVLESTRIRTMVRTYTCTYHGTVVVAHCTWCSLPWLTMVSPRGTPVLASQEEVFLVGKVVQQDGAGGAAALGHNSATMCWLNPDGLRRVASEAQRVAGSRRA